MIEDDKQKFLRIIIGAGIDLETACILWTFAYEIGRRDALLSGRELVAKTFEEFRREHPPGPEAA